MLSNAERNVIMERNIFVLSFPYITIAEGFFMERKVVLITGGSSGIGLAAAKSLLDRGCLVYEISRREHSENGIVHIGADVTDEAAVTTAVDRIIQETGRIDTLINNAGYGISGAVEFTEPEMAKRLFDVDFFGMVNVTRAVLPHMRQAGRGRIVNVSSVAASLPIPFQAYYSAAKAAVNAYTLALADEVKPFGIGVCAVMPGDIRTGFTAARIKEHTGDDIYHGRIGRSVAKMEQDETHGMPCETAGTHIARSALAKKPGTLHTIGLSYRLDIFLSKILPTGLVRYIVGRMYG